MRSIGKVLFAGRHDWANLAHRIARALRSCDVDARVLVERPHPYGYAEDEWGEGEFDAWAASGVDWLLSTGDGAYDFLEATARVIAHQSLGTLHSGSQYRAHHREFNARDQALGARLQFMGVDCLRFAADLPACPMWTPAERWLAPDEKRDGILHCPSSRRSKGTDDVLWAAERAGVTVTLLEHATAGDVAAAMANAAVYVDQINADIGGIGCSAFEAAALGCAVITDGRHWPVHTRRTPPFTQVRDREDLAALFRYLKGSPRIVRTGWHIHNAGLAHRWALHFASPKYVATHWIEALARHAKP